jgi:hypothetical protein
MISRGDGSVQMVGTTRSLCSLSWREGVVRWRQHTPLPQAVYSQPKSSPIRVFLYTQENTVDHAETIWELWI